MRLTWPKYILCKLFYRFTVHVNPFGVKAQNCYISNNADFNDYPTSKTGSTKDRTEQVIANG